MPKAPKVSLIALGVISLVSPSKLYITQNKNIEIEEMIWETKQL